jgi:hypothetical protein
VLTVRAAGRGARAQERLLVHVANHVFALTTSAIHPWQKVKGTLRVHAKAWGARTTGIALYVDGRVRSRDRKAPYVLRWDTRRVHDGRHRISLIAGSVDGRLAVRRLPIVVSNDVGPKPKPRHVPPPQITAASVGDGQTVSGTVDWRAHTIGPVARVEFVVDRTVIATETRGPWAASWDTSTVAPGEHTLEVRAYTRDGRRAVRTVTVTVSPPPS